MFEKPNSTSVKDMLIENIAFDCQFPEDVVEKVIRFQGEDLTAALKKHSLVELSGFGILYVAKTKLKKTIGNYERTLDKSDDKKKESLNKLITYLKGKNVEVR